MKIEQSYYIKGMKHLALNRHTMYNNRFPYNSGFIWANGWISFDCINLIKATINDPQIFYKKKPAGYYAKPGRVIRDLNAPGILATCSGVSSDFTKLVPGSFLMYQDYDHGGLYVGDFEDPSGTVNVVECCDDFVGSGVVTSYVDADGRRYDHKGGQTAGSWVKHGMLSRFIKYKEEKRKTVTEIAKEVIAGKWGNYPERKTRLEAAGYSYKKVQKKVNEILEKVSK